MKSVAVCGITGAVGQETLGCLKNLNFPVSELTLFASERSAGKEIDTPYGKKTIKLFNTEEAQKHDIIFLCVGGDFSKEYGKKLTEKGAVVIDNSSAFRYDKDIPLVIPEINPEAAKGHKLIANPNCTTAIMAVALYPIYKEFGVRKLIVSTYQATSGAGQPAMDELLAETKNYLDGKTPGNKNFAYPIPFNLIPQIDVFQENGYTKEEMKVAWETQKIFGDESIKISCTAVRIPILRAHSESITIETEKPVNLTRIREILSLAPGVDLIDNPAEKKYPMPLTATKKYNTEVGRIRKNEVFGDYGLDFFVSGDQLLKGAALNTVQIAQLFL